VVTGTRKETMILRILKQAGAKYPAIYHPINHASSYNTLYNVAEPPYFKERSGSFYNYN
jgi:hypothetical protein